MMKPILFFFILTIVSTAQASHRDTIYPAWWRAGAVLVTPDKVTSKTKRPLVVVLHGCKITGEDILDLSEIEKYSDKNNFVVLAPNQSRNLNSDNCWNFWHPLNQQIYRSSWATTYEDAYNDVAYISRAIDEAVKTANIDTSQVYLAGLSSGAAMALNVLMCDQDHQYAGVAINSGLAFGVAQDVLSAEDIIANGSHLSKKELKARLQLCPRRGLDKVKLSIIHGDKDVRIIPSNYQDTLKQLTLPCDASTCAGRLQTQLVHGLAHQWSGSQFKSPYGDSTTVPFTPMFLRHFGLIK